MNGELVGGLDIIKEMKNEGPLAAQLGVTTKVHGRLLLCNARRGERLYRVAACQTVVVGGGGGVCVNSSCVLRDVELCCPHVCIHGCCLAKELVAVLLL